MARAGVGEFLFYFILYILGLISSVLYIFDNVPLFDSNEAKLYPITNFLAPLDAWIYVGSFIYIIFILIKSISINKDIYNDDANTIVYTTITPMFILLGAFVIDNLIRILRVSWNSLLNYSTISIVILSIGILGILYLFIIKKIRFPYIFIITCCYIFAVGIIEFIISTMIKFFIYYYKWLIKHTLWMLLISLIASLLITFFEKDSKKLLQKLPEIFIWVIIIFIILLIFSFFWVIGIYNIKT